MTYTTASSSLYGAGASPRKVEVEIGEIGKGEAEFICAEQPHHRSSGI